MATTAAGYQNVAKEVWDGDTMVKQFYDENPWLDALEKRQRVIIGKRAQVPIHYQRAGGTTFSTLRAARSTAADAEDVTQAQFTLAYNYFPVSIEAGALNEITGGAQSIGEALDHMMTSGINNMRNQVTRQFLTGHGRIAASPPMAVAIPDLHPRHPGAGQRGRRLRCGRSGRWLGRPR
jgi:hypothetical protein